MQILNSNAGDVQEDVAVRSQQPINPHQADMDVVSETK